MIDAASAECKPTSGGEALLELCGVGLEDVRVDVREYDVEACVFGPERAEVALAEFAARGHSVPLGEFLGARFRGGVDIEAYRGFGAEHRRGDGQHSAARARVEDAFASADG